MIGFHLVQEGDTLDSIAKQYNIPLKRLMIENDYDYYQDLNIGQIIKISEAEKTYVVKRGDTLSKIAQEQNIPLVKLLQNNPQLSKAGGLEIGDILVLDYGLKETDIALNGMCFSFIAKELLYETLPYLTYITVMGYRVDQEGEINDIDDEYIVSSAMAYGVVPLMLVATLYESGIGSYDITNTIFNQPMLQEKLINNVIEIAKNKGYSGAVFGFQFLLDIDVGNYKNFMDYATTRLQEEGLLCWAVAIPKLLYSNPELERLEVPENLDGVILLSYQWANNFVPNSIQNSYKYYREALEILLTAIEPEKVSLGISRIAYDRELPYVEGESFVSALTDPGALALAAQYKAKIQYDEDARHPYFRYTLNDIQHEVWFKDVRFTLSILDLVLEFGLGGITIWNIMYFSELLITLNIMTNIIKLLPTNDEEILKLLEQ